MLHHHENQSSNESAMVPTIFSLFGFSPEAVSGQSKETALVIYLAFLAKVANLYYIILTAFKKYWSDTLAKFISGTQDTFI